MPEIFVRPKAIATISQLYVLYNNTVEIDW